MVARVDPELARTLLVATKLDGKLRMFSRAEDLHRLLNPPSLNWNVTNLNEDGFPAGVFSFDYVWGLYTLVTMAIAICPISFGMCNSCYQVVTKDDDDTSDIKLKPKKGGSSSNA